MTLRPALTPHRAMLIDAVGQDVREERSQDDEIELLIGKDTRPPFRMDLEAIIAATQIVEQAHGKVGPVQR